MAMAWAAMAAMAWATMARAWAPMAWAAMTTMAKATVACQMAWAIAQMAKAAIVTRGLGINEQIRHTGNR